MRRLEKRKVPKIFRIISVMGIIAAIFYIGGLLISISSNEIFSEDAHFFDKAETKLVGVVEELEDHFGIVRAPDETILKHYFKEENVFKNIGSSIGYFGDTLTMLLMTVFFVVLLLAGSVNLQELLNTVLFKQKYSAVKTFRQIEKDIRKFMRVKIIVSALTGICFFFACVIFDVSFPVFWGLFAFLINFVQMVGSFIAVICLSLFAIIELDPSGTLLIFVLVLTGIQALFGAILEPIFLGKTFSINVVTVLVMLMLWGFIWGVPGLIMAVPITVFVKIILEQFPKTQSVAKLMAG